MARTIPAQYVKYAEPGQLIGTDEHTLVNATDMGKVDMPRGLVDLVLDEFGVVIDVVKHVPASAQ